MEHRKFTLVSGETGTFVRYYGEKVQIRVGDKKITGYPVLTKDTPIVPVTDKLKLVEPVSKLGPLQLKILAAVRKNPLTSYRELGIACSVPTPRAATCMKSLTDKGLVLKTQVDGRNQYKVVD